MGIYICGMEMPTEEEIGKCIIVRHDGEVLSVEFDNLVDGGYVACYPTNPTRAVPVQPHGRLIDVDAIERNLLKMQQAQTGPCSHGVRKSRAVLRDAPTIIPAEPSKEE